eukprot:4736924-Amphidinium_carterae.1
MLCRRALHSSPCRQHVPLAHSQTMLCCHMADATTLAEHRQVCVDAQLVHFAPHSSAPGRSWHTRESTPAFGTERMAQADTAVRIPSPRAQTVSHALPAVGRSTAYVPSMRLQPAIPPATYHQVGARQIGCSMLEHAAWHGACLTPPQYCQFEWHSKWRS